MAEPLTVLLVVGHVGLLGGWLGSMLYSLVIVQPRAARFFAGDDDAHEAFLVVLGAGNRRPVLAIIAAATVTAVLITALSPQPPRSSPGFRGGCGRGGPSRYRTSAPSTAPRSAGMPV